MFISYRWGQRDSVIAASLFDNLGNYNVGDEQRCIDTFLDTKRLRSGEEFQHAFSDALMNSRVACPVLSCDALWKMTNHNPNQCDNVLLEWILCAEFDKSDDPKVKLKKIFPLVIGE